MRIIMLYRPESEHARVVEGYITDYERFHPDKKIEVHSIDSREGSDLSSLYGVMSYPAVIAAKDDGQMQQSWEGVDRLPLMNDLAYYAQQ